MFVRGFSKVECNARVLGFGVKEQQLSHYHLCMKELEKLLPFFGKLEPEALWRLVCRVWQ